MATRLLWGGGCAYLVSSHVYSILSVGFAGCIESSATKFVCVIAIRLVKLRAKHRVELIKYLITSGAELEGNGHWPDSQTTQWG